MIMKTKKFKTLHETYNLACKGEESVQKAIIGCLENLGCAHLAHHHNKDAPKWEKYFKGLEQWMMSQVAEYGMNEFEVEKDLLEELTTALGYSASVLLV